MWKFRYRKEALKFLQKHELLEETKIKIVKFLKGERVDVKKMKGNWEGYLRLRIGNYRIIFKTDFKNNLVDIIKAGPRQEIYK